MTGQRMVWTLMSLFFQIFSTKTETTKMRLPRSSGIEVRVPPVHYLFSGELRVSYRTLTDVFPRSSNILLSDRTTNSTVYNQTVTFVQPYLWNLFEVPCNLFLLPGFYSLNIYRFENVMERISDLIEVRWLEMVSWNLSATQLQMFSQSLTVNVSLLSGITCPQQEPTTTIFFVNLIYLKEDLTENTVASRRLVWPFGSTRFPRNSSLEFPCDLFDRIGSYYATLSATTRGQGFILGRSQTVNASLRASDYSLDITGQIMIMKCYNRTGRNGVRVSYDAPSCIGNDKIRLYKLEKENRNCKRPFALSDLKQAYLMERSVGSRPRHASFNFPCRVFNAKPQLQTNTTPDDQDHYPHQDPEDGALGFCWIYTIVSRDGHSHEVQQTRQCFPASPHAEQVWKVGQRTEWSSWGSWTPCTQTCQTGDAGASGGALRMRKRVCLASEGLHTELCLGASTETVSCHVPQCKDAFNRSADSSFRKPNAFLWLTNSRRYEASHNLNSLYSSYYSIHSYNTNRAVGAFALDLLNINRKFILVVLLILFLIFVVLLLCQMPALYSLLKSPNRRKKATNPKHPDRDSRYALISKDDEPGNATLLTQLSLSNKRLTADQPSRSGVIEMRELTLRDLASKGIVSGHKGHHDTLSNNASRDCLNSSLTSLAPIKIRPQEWPSYVPSPLVLQKMCLEKREASSDQSPRSSSLLSSRPEAGDVDFEYDDFLPAQMAEEEDFWPSSKLDIKVFATAYEDILKELNDSRSMTCDSLVQVSEANHLANLHDV